jgi:hypothetical protein
MEQSSSSSSWKSNLLLVKKFTTFYGTWRFITVFITARHWDLYYETDESSLDIVLTLKLNKHHQLHGCLSQNHSDLASISNIVQLGLLSLSLVQGGHTVSL